MCALYKEIDGKRFFLHEHRARAKSLDLWMCHEILEMPGVVKIMGDQCTFGLWCNDEKRLALVRKSTGWMTNSSKVAKTLDRKCSGEHRHDSAPAERRKHMQKIRSATRERYPIRLVNAVLRALRQEVSERTS